MTSTPTQPGRRRVIAAAVSGLLAAAAGLGVAAAVAAVTGEQGDPVVAVGDAAVNLTPGPVKEFAVSSFGTHDKTVLIAGILVLLGLFAAAIGVAAYRRTASGIVGVAVFAAVGVAAAITRPGAGAVDLAPTLAAAVVAAMALTVLVHAARAWNAGRATRGAGHDPADGAAVAQATVARPAIHDRRGFLIASTAAAAVAVAGEGIGRVLAARSAASTALSTVRLPPPAIPAPPVPPGTSLHVPGLEPFFTPNGDFYRVDIDLVLPRLSPSQWTLRVHGMVDRPMEITFDELLRRSLVEADITMVCVSNEVGGPYVGTARWLGASLADLLREAGIRRGADQVLSTGTDGMTISTPVDTLLDGRPALLAVGMNGRPLPVAHGFPVRMVVPGLYGYVSATKWVVDLLVTTFDRDQAYWTKRGYAAQAPIKTESRIDVPRPFAQLAAGRVVVAGVAWAPTRGISAVQVSVDGGPWHDATLGAADGVDTWRQWMWWWDATPGAHRLQVRAADGAGVLQTARRAPPVPDGASGWDSVVVTVT